MKRKLSAALSALMLLASFGCAKEKAEPKPLVSGTSIASFYNDHENEDEANYKTKLANPAKLRDNVAVYALEPAGLTPELWARVADFSEPDSTWGYDVRWTDISGEDLDVIEDMSLLSFNSQTIWPEVLPEGYDPEQILETNKNPGLGIRDLHESGITGAGVGIAIIGQPLLLGHEQYKDNLVFYEEIHNYYNTVQIGGAAAASIAAGKDTGVAPGSKLYYIATTFGHFSADYSEFTIDASIAGDCILEILKINESLPEDEKIRVISISRSFGSSDKGFMEFAEAISKANEAGVFVLTMNPGTFYEGFSLSGLGRGYFSDPDDVEAYYPVTVGQNYIMVPMGTRTYASSTGTDEYEIAGGSEGTMSWAVPWCAGFYALCCEVKPDITPSEFIAAIKETGITSQTETGGETRDFGKIINPAGVISNLTAAAAAETDGE